MGKKLGLGDAYKGLNIFTGVNKNSPVGTSMKAVDSTKMLTNRFALGIKEGKKLPIGSLLKRAAKKTVVGKAVSAIGSLKKLLTSKASIGAAGAGIGYEAGKKKKVNKKMSGGMMRGYGAARTSGMGLEDESLSPGKTYKANKGYMVKK